MTCVSLHRQGKTIYQVFAGQGAFDKDDTCTSCCCSHHPCVTAPNQFAMGSLDIHGKGVYSRFTCIECYTIAYEPFPPKEQPPIPKAPCCFAKGNSNRFSYPTATSAESVFFSLVSQSNISKTSIGILLPSNFSRFAHETACLLLMLGTIYSVFTCVSAHASKTLLGYFTVSRSSIGGDRPSIRYRI